MIIIIIVIVIEDTQYRAVVLVYTKIIAFPVGYFIGAATKEIISKTTITISNSAPRVGITRPSLLYSYGARAIYYIYGSTGNAEDWHL